MKTSALVLWSLILTATVAAATDCKVWLEGPLNLDPFLMGTVNAQAESLGIELVSGPTNKTYHIKLLRRISEDRFVLRNSYIMCRADVSVAGKDDYNATQISFNLTSYKKRPVDSKAVQDQFCVESLLKSFKKISAKCHLK